MPAKSWFLSTQGVIVTATILTVIAALENSILPWSPFFIVYATLAILIPFVLKTYRFGSIKAIPWWHWLVGIIAAVLFQFLGRLIVFILFASLSALGIEASPQNPSYGLGAAEELMIKTAALRLNTTPETINTAYTALLLLWAGFGEEVFYNGYIQGVLRQRHSFTFAMLVSSFYFAIRHYTQLLLLLPNYPIIAVSTWVLWTFIIGLIISYVYERTRSLYLPIYIHYLINFVPLLLGILMNQKN